jgi:hypothetical protein
MVLTGSNWLRIGTSGGGALVITVMNLLVPYNCWEFPEWLHKGQLLRKGSAP